MLEGEPEKVFPEVLCYEERKAESEDGTEQMVKVRIVFCPSELIFCR